MTIELDSTLAQAEVLFLSFSQLVADIDRRTGEAQEPSASGLRRRGAGATTNAAVVGAPIISQNLRDLLNTE
jgi:hypothetical protein